jgi:hypothetical protein
MMATAADTGLIAAVKGHNTALSNWEIAFLVLHSLFLGSV